jgi:hypothetical protein
MSAASAASRPASRVVDAIHAVDVAADARACGVQAVIGDATRAAEARQVVEIRVLHVPLNARIANDVGERVDTALVPGAGVQSHFVQRPDHDSSARSICTPANVNARKQRSALGDLVRTDAHAWVSATSSSRMPPDPDEWTASNMNVR